MNILRLVQASKEQMFAQVDWDKWVDEDEQDEADPKKDFDLGDLQNFSNFGGGDFGAGLGGGMSGIGNVEVHTAIHLCMTLHVS